ncbi:hypothetical protein CONPUDRAFT_157656 [Coniophora puteana RWD-64-598 SS2]|uniref:Uncharacterized protein n=1 Tax=Coniophora puteana (strain RWD-64-598) TaxID=741705 RepID=A0A5M3MEH3_CONPW|nr:uncharacterized protein CONPUDRAFT_157656 [Coniophora puteana RWD-64-598 SS2]EIW77406.1 hypothetical protein CONPUDRAFT_157656 [Coniophora puteana RWD-64-598 SS2]
MHPTHSAPSDAYLVLSAVWQTSLNRDTFEHLTLYLSPFGYEQHVGESVVKRGEVTNLELFTGSAHQNVEDLNGDQDACEMWSPGAVRILKGLSIEQLERST